MNLQTRVEKYEKRGFQQLEAQILVLIEEAAAAIFSSFPEHFILFGGATLVLFYDSPRLSRDLDLLASPAELPSPDAIEAAVRSGLQPVAEIFGLGQLDFRRDTSSPDFIRYWLIANQKPLFSIDLTRIGGSVLQNQVVRQTIATAPERTVLAPTPEYLLLQKCETFLGRRYVKGRDAFDIHLLSTRGVKLGTNLYSHLEDFITMRELDAASIRDRIRSLTPRVLTAELRSMLPVAVFEELAKEDFGSIRRSVRTVFARWLEVS